MATVKLPLTQSHSLAPVTSMCFRTAMPDLFPSLLCDPGSTACVRAAEAGFYLLFDVTWCEWPRVYETWVEKLGVESRASPVVADRQFVFLLQDSFWAQDMWGFSTAGQGLATFPVCKMVSIHAVQIQNQGDHRPPSASDLTFLTLCGERRIVPFAQTSVWCVYLYTVG